MHWLTFICVSFACPYILISKLNHVIKTIWHPIDAAEPAECFHHFLFLFQITILNLLFFYLFIIPHTERIQEFLCKSFFRQFSIPTSRGIG